MDPGTPGHSELHMVIPEDILLEGVDADTPFVPIEIKSPVAGMPAYPNIEEGDRIFLYWGSEKIEHVVTDEEANDPDNHVIVITVDKAVIDKEGDSEADGIPVAFYVLDVVNNRSEDWSATTYIDVDTGSPRLGAPLIKEADNNKLDIDDLPDPDTVTAQVIAVGSGFAVGDEIEMRLRGVTNDGEAVDKTYPLVQIDSINKVIDIPLPSIDVRLLVNTRAAFSYRLIKSDGSDDRLSKSQFIEVIGEATQLAAPIAKDAIAGTLDPALPSTLIEIPWDESMTKGQVIDLKWLGTRGPQIYLPTLPPRLISDGEERDKESLYISVDGEHLRAIDGGTLELFYLLLRDTEAREVVSRQSLHADLLNIGEPVAELPPPVVEREQGGVLDPADVPNGTRLIVRQYTDQIRGDEVHYVWNGSRTGIKIDSAPVTEINENSDIPFSIHFDLVKNNEGGTVKASYWVTRVTGRISPSEVLPMYIGTPMDLAAPSVKQATGVSPNQQLNPVAAKDDLTVVIPNYGIQPGDQVRVTWAGAPGGGSYTTPLLALPSSREIPLPVSVLAYNLDRSVTVTYTVTPSGGSESEPSRALTLNVQAIPDISLPMPLIPQAAQGGIGSELDLSTFIGDARVTVAPWPLIAAGQRVWLRVEGTAIDNSRYTITLYTASIIGAPQMTDGLSEELLRSELEKLRDGSPLNVVLQVTFDRSSTQANAVDFPLRTYTLKTVALVAPTLTDITDSKGTVVGGTTVETSVTVTGTGSSGRQIQLMNVTGPIGNPVGIPDNSTNWSAILTNLAPMVYNIRAQALYGTGLPDSAMKAFIVTAVVTPTIVDIVDSKGSVVGGTTTETSVTVIGTGSSGQQIQLMDGDNAIGGPIDIPFGTTAWTAPLTGLTTKAYNIKARALYGTGVPDSAAKGFNVQASATPTITAVSESATPAIPNGGVTAATSVVLTGRASPGFSIDLFDNDTPPPKGTFVATGGTWTTTTPIAVAPGPHSFTAKAKYGSEPVSEAWTFTVITLTDQNKPYIQQAENNGTGATLDLGTFAGDATVKVSPWPGIAAGQRVWLRCLGKKANGSDHIITLYTASEVIPTEVPNGLSKNIPRAQLEELGDSTPLTVQLKIKFNGSSSEDAATAFPLRAYTVRAIELITPTLDSVKDAGEVEIPDGTTTVSLTLKLTGTASKGQKVEIYEGTGNGAALKGDATANANTGIWTKDITVDIGSRRLYAKASYPVSPVFSNVRLLTVVEVVVPTLTDIRDSQGSVVDGTTVETSVTVTGTGSKGQQIQLLDGPANIGNPFRVPTNSTNWSTPLTGLTVKAYSIKARALYGAGVPDSAAKGFNVQASATPTITAVSESATPAIPNGGVTAATSVVLTGRASPGFSIDLFDNDTPPPKGTFVATGGTWTTTTPIAVAPGPHSFTAKAKYGSEPVSGAWTFTVITLTDQNKPYIQQAENNGTGATLDLSTFAGDATVKVSPWPGIAAGQRVWLRCLGKKANGSDHIITLYTASEVIPTEVPNGLSKNIPRAQLEELGDNTPLTVELKIKFNGSTSGDAATVFPLRTYTVKTVVLLAPSITTVRDPTNNAVIPNGSDTYATTFILYGTAQKNEHLQVFDHTTYITDVDVDGDGNWNRLVGPLTPEDHLLTAKAMYGNNPESNAWRIKILPLIRPVITGFTNGRAVANGGSTPWPFQGPPTFITGRRGNVAISGTAYLRSNGGEWAAWQYQNDEGDSTNFKLTKGGVQSFNRGHFEIKVVTILGQDGENIWSFDVY
ncbi:hypothetical protein [Pseudomonas gingeri]|uniref:Ig-like domain (Group 3) n=1 Tax=Pseudomonas gingeri TaxID=117681 RepID=A0A7Y7WXS2_9PSED|nr:hypothetical protein [Pseudomonas gingeri]NWB89452.1 hypothetical protein [Pseudomonas gingeri]